MSVVKGALDYALSKIGCAYSQAKRMNTNPDIFDCSSLIYRGFKFAGYIIETGTTSTTMVNDVNFSLIWPQNRSALGKQFTSVAALKKAGYVPQPGDIVYLYTNSATTRANKITHVVMVVDENTIVHARGTTHGVRKDSIDLYGSKVVAVTRFKEEVESIPYYYNAECTGDGVRIRKAGNTSATILGKLNKGDPMVAEYTTADWAFVVTIIDGAPISGYMSMQYISGVKN